MRVRSRVKLRTMLRLEFSTRSLCRWAMPSHKMFYPASIIMIGIPFSYWSINEMCPSGRQHVQRENAMAHTMRRCSAKRQ